MVTYFAERRYCLSKRQRLTGAEATIATLRAFGVQTVFGIPGVHTLPLYDVLYDEPGVRHVLARHEQGAGFMAEGYARATGKPGVVLSITGPGVTNLATPVASAYSDSIPLLVIASSLPLDVATYRRGELHELKNQLGVMDALAGWTRAVEYVEDIPVALHEAFQTMLQERPRGAYLQIPLDLFKKRADVEIPAPITVVRRKPTEQTLAAAVRLLREAKRPLLLAGMGVTAANANAELAQLAELLQAPVLLGSKSHAVLPGDFPLALPITGNIPHQVQNLVSSADVVLVVGSKLNADRTDSGQLSFPQHLIQIDIDPTEIEREYAVAVPMVADARVALTALLEALHGVSVERPAYLQEIATLRESLRSRVVRVFGESVTLLDGVREALPRDGIVVADMTMLGYASAQYLPMYEPRSYIHPNELCTIGCGLPLAIGAKVGAPEKPVVALCGDGGFLLNASELATAVQEQVPVVVLLFNDATYTAVKNSQRRHFEKRYIATDLIAPDYIALARSFGARGVQAEGTETLRAALTDALQHTGPTLINVPLPPKAW